jgi:hypothetical protein
MFGWTVGRLTPRASLPRRPAAAPAEPPALAPLGAGLAGGRQLRHGHGAGLAAAGRRLQRLRGGGLRAAGRHAQRPERHRVPRAGGGRQGRSGPTQGPSKQPRDGLGLPALDGKCTRRAPLQAKRLAAAGGQAADKGAADKAALSADGKTTRAGKRPEAEAAAAPAPAKYVVRPRALPESTVEKVRPRLVPPQLVGLHHWRASAGAAELAPPTASHP